MALITVSNLKITFSDRDIFSDVSFKIEHGDKIGFVGVNGAGKTTLFKALTGNMFPPTERFPSAARQRSAIWSSTLAPEAKKRFLTRL